MQPLGERARRPDFFRVFARAVDPGINLQTHNVPKVVGGLTRTCSELAIRLDSHQDNRAGGSTRVAEMVKLLENRFGRSISVSSTSSR